MLAQYQVSTGTMHSNSNRFGVSRIKTNTGSRAFSISGPALRDARAILTFWTFLSHPHDRAFSHPGSSVVRLPVDEPALASIMTHDLAKDLCASELGPLRIYGL